MHVLGHEPDCYTNLYNRSIPPSVAHYGSTPICQPWIIPQVPLRCGITGRSFKQNVDTAYLPMRDLGDIEVKYFDTRRFLGRGGKIRLLLRAKQIKHAYESIELTKETEASVIALQQELIQTGDSPTGQLPILLHEKKTFCETAAILRYLGKCIGEYGSDHYQDYLADMIIDKLAYWSDDLMVAITEINVDNANNAVKLYLTSRRTYLALFERLVELAGESIYSTCPFNKHSPSWCACAIAATIFDDIQLMAMINSSASLLEYPHVQKLYEDVMELPLVKDICIEKEMIRLTEENLSKFRINRQDISQETTATSSMDNKDVLYNQMELPNYEIPLTGRGSYSFDNFSSNEWQKMATVPWAWSSVPTQNYFKYNNVPADQMWGRQPPPYCHNLQQYQQQHQYQERNQNQRHNQHQSQNSHQNQQQEYPSMTMTNGNKLQNTL